MTKTDTNQPKTPVYLDYQATTPVDPAVFEAMEPYFMEAFANPHSVDHQPGRAVAERVEEARADVAALIGAEAREIIFTSGATESNNLAIKGAARFLTRKDKDHVVTVASEHKCVLESVKRLDGEGFRTTFLPVDREGMLDPSALEAAIDDKTALVSVMAVNNEIGVIQPLEEVGRICKEKGVLFHCDAAQGFGKIALDVEAMGIDLMSISGHKIYGPKGIGALYVRRRPRVRLEPLFDGGGQERGLRSGTLPAPLCIGLGKAAVVAGEGMEAEAERLSALRERFLEGLRGRIDGVVVNGSMEHRLAGNLNLSLAGVTATKLLEAVPDLALATGSACSSADVEPSYVLEAMGLSESEARSAIRVGFGRPTTEAEVDFAVATLADAIAALREKPEVGAAE